MPEQYIILFLLGAVFGYIGGYAGIGGAPLLIALTVIIFNISQYTAQGTILAVMLGPMTLPAVIFLKDRVKILKWYILSAVLSYAFFSYFGAVGAYAVDEKVLKLLFGTLLVILGIIDIIFSGRLSGNDPPLDPDRITFKKSFFPVNMFSLTLVGVAVGVFGGFFGIGAGVLMVPLFINLFGIHKDDARAMSLAILLPPVSIGAVIKYHTSGGIRWDMAGIIFLAYFLTNYFGAKKGKAHSPRRFKLYFGIIMIAIGIAYYLQISGIL